MKKSYSIVLLTAIAVTSLFGHPPGKITMEFHPDESLLKLVIFHGVKTPAKHFINKVTVSLNGAELISQRFITQEDNRVQSTIYKIIDAKPTDKITVSAFCNIHGKKKETALIRDMVKKKEE